MDKVFVSTFFAFLVLAGASLALFSWQISGAVSINPVKAEYTAYKLSLTRDMQAMKFYETEFHHNRGTLEALEDMHTLISVYASFEDRLNNYYTFLSKNRIELAQEGIYSKEEFEKYQEIQEAIDSRLSSHKEYIEIYVDSPNQYDRKLANEILFALEILQIEKAKDPIATTISPFAASRVQEIRLA